MKKRKLGLENSSKMGYINYAYEKVYFLKKVHLFVIFNILGVEIGMTRFEFREEPGVRPHVYRREKQR